MSQNNCVAHLDMDAFYVAVELLRHPELRGKPVIVAGGGPRAVVTTASYEARPFGVGSAMPVSQAMRRCPEAIRVPVDHAHYRGVSRQVMELIAELEVPTEPVSLDEVYLDLGGVPDPVARMSGLVRAIRERLSLDASVGIGPNKLVAKIASDAEKPRGFVVLTREQAAARFAGESPRLIPGIGPKTSDRLAALGVKTIGTLQRCTLPGLIERFGRREVAEAAAAAFVRAAVAAVELARDAGQRAQLLRAQLAVGNGDARHRRVALHVPAVLQAQRPEVVVGQLARRGGARAGRGTAPRAGARSSGRIRRIDTCGDRCRR